MKYALVNNKYIFLYFKVDKYLAINFLLTTVKYLTIFYLKEISLLFHIVLLIIKNIMMINYENKPYGSPA